MSYRSKKEAMAGIVRRSRIRNGVKIEVYDAYLGYDPFTHKQKRLSSANLDSLKAAIQRFYAAHSVGGDLAVRLSAAQAQDAHEALDLLAQAKMDISITEAVRRFLGGSGCATKRCSISVGKAYDTYTVSISAQSELQRKAVHYRVGSWVDDFGRERPLSDVSATEVGAWLARICNSPKTYNNRLSYIKTFLNWCMKKERGWITENPLADMEKKPIAYVEPKYITAEDAERLFRALEGRRDRRDLLAYAILSFFCGIRREEILRMATMADAANINLDDETIRISKPKGWTKGIMPRAFQIMPNALAWMRSFPFEVALGDINDHCADDVKEIASKVGVSLPKNAGRHTFITMHIAAFQNAATTEAIVGTSKAMRVRNYCGLAAKRDGEAYFAIMPRE